MAQADWGNKVGGCVPTPIGIFGPKMSSLSRRMGHRCPVFVRVYGRRLSCGFELAITENLSV